MDKATVRELRADAVRKRDELDGVVKYFDTLLGESGSEIGEAPGNGPALVGSPSSADNLLTFVSKSEFVGISAMQAAEQLLKRIELRTGARRHIRVPELYEALTKGGNAPIKKEGLYTSIARSAKFVNIGQGHWGLATWHPDMVKKPRNAPQHVITRAEPAIANDEGGEAGDSGEG